MIGCCCCVEQISAVADAGFDFVEIKAQDLCFITGREALPVRAVNNFLPRHLNLFLDKDQYAAIKNLSHDSLQTCRDKGVGVITLGSGRSRRIAGMANYAEVLKRWSDFINYLQEASAPLGVMVGIEPLVSAETDFLNTIEQTLQSVDIQKLANIGITMDSHHFFGEKNKITDIYDLTGKIVHVHISDDNRGFPNKLSDRCCVFLSEIAKSGYAGGVSIETSWNAPFDINPQIVEELKSFLTYPRRAPQLLQRISNGSFSNKCG